MTVLDRRVYALAKENRTARLFMTAAGAEAITPSRVASAYDDPTHTATLPTGGGQP
jgi:hypothetical protein